MAASGFTPIQLYRTTTAAAVPVDTNLAAGELALNTTDEKLYFKNAAGTVKLLASNATTTNVSSITFGSTGLTPATATTGAVTVAGTLAVANGGTGVTSSTGTTNVVLSNGPTLVAPVLGTPASGTVTNLTGTASININGTVGATTATTGAFTSITASADSSFTSTGAVLISKGTTAERPAGVSGKLRFNTTTSEFEGYTGAAWASVGGSAIVNDTTTATNIYPLLASATSGTASTVNTSNAKLLYKPSTGEFQSSALVASNGLVVNSATVAVSYSIAAGNNAMSSGPITVNGGITVTVPSGSRWVVL
jgi:hypothetical protein